MKPFFSSLMALGLLLGLAGHAKAQPTYSFTTLDVPVRWKPKRRKLSDLAFGAIE